MCMGGQSQGFGYQPQQQYYGSAMQQPGGVASYTNPNFGGFNFGNYQGMNYAPNGNTTTGTGTQPVNTPMPNTTNWWTQGFNPFGSPYAPNPPSAPGPDQHTGFIDQTPGTTSGTPTDTRPVGSGPVTPPVTPPVTAPPGGTGGTLDLMRQKSYDPSADGYAGGANQYQIRNGAANVLSGVPQQALQAIQMMGQSNDPGALLGAVGQQLSQQGMSQQTIDQIVQQARGGGGQGIVQATQGMGQPSFAGSPYANFFTQTSGWQPGMPFRQV